MNNVEIYNKYYKGLRFHTYNSNMTFKMNGTDENNMVEIIGFNVDGSPEYLDVDNVLSSIKHNYWNIKKLDLRKRKIEILKNDI